MVTALLLTACHNTAAAQPAEFTCASSAPAGQNATTVLGPAIPVTGPFRSLVVYVQYRDDPRQSPPNCGPDDWPIGTPQSPTMPAIGTRILDADQAGPFDSESLTSYYRNISRGNFTVYGDEFAYVTRSNESTYLLVGGSCAAGLTCIDYGRISRELLEDIVNPSVPPDANLSLYTTNGTLNHLFVVLRSKTFETGILGGRYVSGISDLGSGVPTSIGGVNIVSGTSGSFNLFQGIDPLRENVFVLAHEMGHDIWTQSVHLDPITGNNVPALPPFGSAFTTGDRFVAHALMISGNNSAGRVGGNSLTSAAERAYVARTITDPAKRWISCVPVLNGLTYSVRDAAFGSDCYTLNIPISDGAIREIYMSNMQRTSPFNVLGTAQTSVNDNCPGCRTVEVGLPTTGLLVETVRRFSGAGAYWARDVMPADNRLSGLESCDVDINIGPTVDQAYAGDFWRPGLDRQLTPWTRPNVYGYNTLADLPSNSLGAVLQDGLHAIDDIRQGMGTNIDFTYHRFYQTQPVAYVREDWWIGNEMPGLTFNDLRVQAGATLRITATTPLTFNGDLVVEPGGQVFVSPGAQLRFAMGKRIIVYGTYGSFVAEGTPTAPTTLTSIDVYGWGGIYVGPLPGAGKTSTAAFAALPPAMTLSGVTVSNVRYFSPLIDDVYQPYASVDVVNRRVLLSNGTQIVGSPGALANGVRAIGATAQVAITSESKIRDSDGVGIYAIAGAQVAVRDRATVQRNTQGGAYLYGYGTRIDIDTQSQVINNLAAGVFVDAQAHARIRADGSGVQTSISLNRGGPTATRGASIDAGQCTPTSAAIRPNLIANNQLNGFYDARAEDGSTVAARYAFWGSGRTALTLIKDKSSTTAVFPLAATPTQVDPGCVGISERGTGGSAQMARQTDRSDAGEAPAARGRDLTDAVVVLAGQARQQAWDGDLDGAFVSLHGAGNAALTDDDREAVYEAIGALVASSDSTYDVSAVVSDLGTTAAGTGADRFWAMRALAVAYASTDRPEDADLVSASLTVGDAATAHAAFGHGLRVRLAVEADSASLAVERLAAFEAVVASTDTVAVETLAAARALVMAAFPDADLSALSGRPAGRGAAAGNRGAATPTDGTPARDAFEDGVTVYPNPASGRALVTVSLSRESNAATVAVYDALGRRVASLHDGPLGVGPHAFAIEAASMAPGVYVIHVDVRAGTGQGWSETRRVTIAR